MGVPEVLRFVRLDQARYRIHEPIVDQGPCRYDHDQEQRG